MSNHILHIMQLLLSKSLNVKLNFQQPRPVALVKKYFASKATNLKKCDKIFPDLLSGKYFPFKIALSRKESVHLPFTVMTDESIIFWDM